MLNILIADDHLSVRLGMRLLVEDTLGKCAVDFAGNGTELIKALRTNSYHMLITDMNMPQADMLQLVPAALSIQPQLRILVISVNPESIFAKHLLAAGAFGYLQKDAPEPDIVAAIRNISNGKKYLSSSQLDNLDQLLSPVADNSPFSRLSGREMEVVLLLLKGKGPLEISAALSVSASTASSFKARVFEKLGVSNVIDLNWLAQMHGLSGPGTLK
ncbi:MAG: response regulator [Candidatus Pseudobacter hemicellulosilyticus]|uniref:Response regulator n=1 Tax=Candidatus Pseudobacter hemicellulosilyticus TaxID=3121375 RepID=A0AAJ6BHW8_9BACT|nr:MAG: response regulator [Pseudobacter sp.]